MLNLNTPGGEMTQKDDQQERERLEIAYWQVDPHERPGAFNLDNFLVKMADASVFLSEVRRFDHDFQRASVVLELGGGQLWASCIVKHLYPELTVIGSDISPEAIASVPKWESIFRTEIDQQVACRSYDIPLAANSVDLIFCFQAAHHFGDQRQTLIEASRVLAKGGVLLYLSEPVTSKLFYNAALRRVNRMRPEVREDLLIIPEMTLLAEELGFSLQMLPRVDLIHPSLGRVLYYLGLKAFPPLRKLLPNAACLRFQKAG
jgi:SAM-dependent methyltransferase